LSTRPTLALYFPPIILIPNDRVIRPYREAVEVIFASVSARGDPAGMSPVAV
jgi:hypothetical protein